MDVFPADSELLAETLIARMDAAAVDRAVVISLDHEPRYLLECLRSHPERLHGVAVVDPADSDPAATFRRLHAGGVQGIRTGVLASPGEARLGRREEVLLHTLDILGGVLWFYGSSDQIPALTAATRAFPRVAIVLNHLAFFPDGLGVDADGNRTIATDLPPATFGVVRSLAMAHANLMVVISGQYAFSRRPFPHDDLAATTQMIVEAFGPDRCMWGSDHPASDPSASYADIASLPARHLPGLDTDDLVAIMGGTAERLFGGAGR